MMDAALVAGQRSGPDANWDEKWKWMDCAAFDPSGMNLATGGLHCGGAVGAISGSPDSPDPNALFNPTMENQAT